MLPLVVMSLPTMEQRATYVRAFVWAMPERVQQVGCTAWGGLAGCARYRQSKYGCSQLAAFLPGWPWHGSRGPLFF